VVGVNCPARSFASACSINKDRMSRAFCCNAELSSPGHVN
jgi:hypothetical protein